MALIRVYPCPSVVLLVDMQVYFKSGFMAIFWNRSTRVMISNPNPAIIAALCCDIDTLELAQAPIALAFILYHIRQFQKYRYPGKSSIQHT